MFYSDEISFRYDNKTYVYSDVIMTMRWYESWLGDDDIRLRVVFFNTPTQHRPKHSQHQDSFDTFWMHHKAELL